MRPVNALLWSSFWASSVVGSAAPAWAAGNPPSAKPAAAANVPGASLASAAKPPALPEKSDADFEKKLREMLDRSDKSIKIVREQILKNQSAPFLADLYLQLGDFLSQKSSALYYIQMERDKGSGGGDDKASKRFSPAVAAQQEAIAIYEQIVKEFPKFDKLERVLYRLAVAQKSIDEGAALTRTAERLIALYPKSKEAIQAQVLLGQFYFDLPDLDQAMKHLEAAAASEFPYERAAARYRIGLIEILREHHAAALKRFEQVATDESLKEEDNPNDAARQAKGGKSDIKREALIDSVRAYTEANKVNPDPVAYYSRVAPTETLFQETIEKLAFRYIFLKQYGNAIRLMRTLAERIADPQKIMSIYHEVLLMIPVQDRLDVPASEIRFVLDKFSYWSTHFQLSPQTEKESSEFFETQARELGTRNHDYAKKETDPKRKSDLFERAGAFYELYLGFFPDHANAVKIATNLADVRYNQKRYLTSGDLYLRVFLGEFGNSPQKEALIQNAILSLQKPADYEFYEQLRAKGLLVKSIRSYQAFDKRKKADPELNFALAKTLYEQGYYGRALNDLYLFMKVYPKASQVTPASELILNYFNIRSDFKGLVTWTDKMLRLNPVDPKLRDRLKTVKSKALLRRLDEDVKSRKGYDVFAQSKSYLEAAMSSGDSQLRSAALEQALGRAKAEKDIDTFLRAAEGMAKAETNPQKRAELFASVGDETLAIGRYSHALGSWARAAAVPGASAQLRAQMQSKAAKIALLMRDLGKMGELLASAATPAEAKTDLLQRSGPMVTSAAAVPATLGRAFGAAASSDDDLLAAFKAKGKIPEAGQSAKISAKCSQGAGAPVCKWLQWDRTYAALGEYLKSTASAPAAMTAIEPQATKLTGFINQAQALQGSGDPQLDMLLAASSSQAYKAFGDFLTRAANANAAVAGVLKQKAKESFDSAQKSRGECSSILSSSQTVSPTNAVCKTGVAVNSAAALRWPRSVAYVPAPADPSAADVQALQKKIFSDRKDAKLQLDLAELYLAKRFDHHAAAAAAYGSATFPGNEADFELVQGCALARMGFASEAAFRLSKASDGGGRKQQCLNQAKGLAN